MSMDRCDACNRTIDTDIDHECYDTEGYCLCYRCRDIKNNLLDNRCAGVV